MKSNYLVFVCLILCMLTAAPLLASGPTGGSYTWASFSYSWNKNTQPSLQLNKAVPTNNGYTVDYGYTSTLDIYMEHGAVVGTCANFVGGGENDAGGRIFTLLIAKSIDIGTYHWPQAHIDEARNTFKFIGKTHREYSYNTTQFVLDYSPSVGWKFCMNYFPNER